MSAAWSIIIIFIVVVALGVNKRPHISLTFHEMKLVHPSIALMYTRTFNVQMHIFFEIVPL